MNVTVYSINHQHTRFTCSYDAKVINTDICYSVLQLFSASVFLTFVFIEKQNYSIMQYVMHMQGQYC